MRALAAEEKCSKLNRLKILNQWRKLMRLVKVEDLRKEIEIISQHHEREVDRKDAIIQVLDRDLEDSEEQYQMALRAHLVMVDRLIDLHNDKLGGAELEFEKDLRELMDERGRGAIVTGEDIKTMLPRVTARQAQAQALAQAQQA